MSEVLLGELLSSRGITYGVVKPGNHTTDGIPLIKAADVGNGRVNSIPNFRISQEKHQEHSRTKLNGGELLITLVGNPGQCAIAPPEVKGFNVVRAVGVFNVEPIADSRFIMYSIQAPQSQVYIRNVCNTTVQATLNLGDLKSLPLNIPDIKEQKAIAHILGTLDDKIELNRKTNETLEWMAKALFKSWFVDFDPVRAKAEGRPTGLPAEISDLFPDTFEDSGLGEIPSGWFATNLGNEVDLQTGFTFKSDLFSHSPPGVRLARGMNVKEGVFFWESQARFWTEMSEEIEKYLLRSGDILIGMDGSKVGKNWVRVRKADLPCLLVQRVARLRRKESIGESIIRILIGNPDFSAYIDSVKTGTSIPHISKSQIKEYCFFRPNPGDNRLFALFEEVAKPMTEKFDSNYSQTNTLQSFKDALLPKLISGEIRIPDAQRMLEEVGI